MWRAPCYDRRLLPPLTLLLESSVSHRHSKDSCALRSGCQLTCRSSSRIVRSIELVDPVCLKLAGSLRPPLLARSQPSPAHAQIVYIRSRIASAAPILTASGETELVGETCLSTLWQHDRIEPRPKALSHQCRTAARARRRGGFP